MRDYFNIFKTCHALYARDYNRRRCAWLNFYIQTTRTTLPQTINEKLIPYAPSEVAREPPRAKGARTETYVSCRRIYSTKSNTICDIYCQASRDPSSLSIVVARKRRPLYRAECELIHPTRKKKFPIFKLYINVTQCCAAGRRVMSVCVLNRFI